MITRSAFFQLKYSPLLLIGTILGLALVWFAAPLAILFGGFGSWRFFLGLATYGLGVLSFFPTLTRYNQPRYIALALPGIAAFYMAATIASAVQYWRGQGAKWKNRAYGEAL
jgi:hypothetical protein